MCGRTTGSSKREQLPGGVFHGAPRHERVGDRSPQRRGAEGVGGCRPPHSTKLSTQLGVWPAARRHRGKQDGARRAYRDDFARRHGLDRPGARSTAAASSTVPSAPTPFARNTSSRRNAGRCRRRASTSSSASRRSNLFLQLAALGLAGRLFGTRLSPIGTLYDPFIKRGHDALNYACYQDARFILVATPSSITLAPEGGAHQSVGEPLTGIAQPGLASFEPAYADELAVLLRWAFEEIQREEGQSVYFRLPTRPIDQPQRTIGPDLAKAIIAGGYWLREPTEGAELAIAYCGAVAPEALAAHQAIRR
jgi:hypothetical protein